MSTSNQFWRRERVLAETGFSNSTLHMMMQEGRFPKSFKIGARSVAWLSDEIEAWKQARLDARNGRAA
jgi:prophage regulatory protein